MLEVQLPEVGRLSRIVHGSFPSASLLAAEHPTAADRGPRWLGLALIPSVARQEALRAQLRHILEQGLRESHVLVVRSESPVPIK